MMKQRKEKAFQSINIDLYLFLLIFYGSFILLSDYITYIFHTNLVIVTYIISFLLLIAFYILFRKRIKIQTSLFDKNDVIFILILFGFFLLRVAIPDTSFDTANYHLFLQEFPFANNLSYNFLPARWVNSYTLPLADRFHYFFRLLTNYRWGMIANAFALVIVYYQSKKILTSLFKTSNKLLIDILALSCLFSVHVFANLNTYYVDLLYIPFLMECIILLFKNQNEKSDIYLLAIVGGFACSLKITNAIFVILFIILYLINNRKNITFKSILWCIIPFLLPLLPYLLNNYLQTGNPVFPYYNSIFKSPYYYETSWTDNRFGPKSPLQTLLYPIYIFIHPGATSEFNIYFGRITYAYLSCFLVIIISFIQLIFHKNKLSPYFYLSCLFIIMCFLWAKFMIGYMRYGLVLEILGGIITFASIYYLYQFKNVFLNVFIIALIGCTVYQNYNSIDTILNKNIEWSWRYSIVNSLGQKESQENFSRLFVKDEISKEYTKTISCFVITEFNSSYATLLNSDIPIIQIGWSKTTEQSIKLYDSVISSCSNYYTIYSDNYDDDYWHLLDENNFKVTNNRIELQPYFLNPKIKLYLVELERV